MVHSTPRFRQVNVHMFKPGVSFHAPDSNMCKSSVHFRAPDSNMCKSGRRFVVLNLNNTSFEAGFDQIKYT